ncbi:hypothetical protein [Frankia sp. ACN1ag]|uniref:hypothetical protein n=1 Tax=Frankia sp. ACN1ag TaxID=102891 RepID=UPI000B1FCEB5|nr:hypothetical protein [Frankia sp. ACN1ag]
MSNSYQRVITATTAGPITLHLTGTADVDLTAAGGPDDHAQITLRAAAGSTAAAQVDAVPVHEDGTDVHLTLTTGSPAPGARPDRVHNQITGNVSGSIIQAGDIGGGIVLGSGRRGRDVTVQTGAPSTTVTVTARLPAGSTVLLTGQPATLRTNGPLTVRIVG